MRKKKTENKTIDMKDNMILITSEESPWSQHGEGKEVIIVVTVVTCFRETSIVFQFKIEPL